MISRLFKTKPKSVSLQAPSVPDQMVVWAVGDIHGRLDLLEPLVEAITADAGEVDAARKVAIFLGDYVDRGPDSRGVLRYLNALRADRSIEWRYLLGNHEQTMLDFLIDPSAGPKWCDYGGDATLASFDLCLPNLKHKQEGWVRLAADLDHRVTMEERRFLQELELSIEIGDYFFSHAGARPGQPLNKQSSRDLLWIRNSFLDDDRGFDRIVVHGHTPSIKVHSDHRRIGIDTKAYSSNILTALRLEGSSRSVIQAVGPPEGGHARLVRSDVAIARSQIA